MGKASAKAVDFSGVKDRGNFNPKQVEAGDYRAKVVKVEDGESKKDEQFQYVFTIKLEKFSQHSYPYYCKLQENQLWKLRNLLVAAGLNVPKTKMKLDPNKVVGKTIGVTMEDDEYEGKMKSTIGAVFPASELADDAGGAAADDADFEEAPADDEPKKSKKDKGAKEKGAKDGKKGKKKKGSEENLEELDISEL